MITAVLLGLSAIYVLIYGSGKHASVEVPSSYPATLGGPGANDGGQQEQHYKRNTVDTNMINNSTGSTTVFDTDHVTDHRKKIRVAWY